MPRRETPEQRERRLANKRRWYAANRDKAIAGIRRCQVAAKREARRIADEGKRSGCVACGEKELCCLSYHHRDPETKDASVAQLVNIYKTPKRVAAEIAKCVVLCENCHRKLHAGLIRLSPTP